MAPAQAAFVPPRVILDPHPQQNRPQSYILWPVFICATLGEKEQVSNTAAGAVITFEALVQAGVLKV